MEDKIKKPRGGKYSPVIGDNGVKTQPGDNAKYAGLLAEILRWGPVDKTDPAAMEERFWRYVDLCAANDMRVTNMVAYLAMGINKDDADSWTRRGLRTKAHYDLIKKVRAFCSAYREILGAEGKLNPVTLVWWQKNYDGFVDKTELVVAPQNMLGEKPDMKQLEERIAAALPIHSDDGQ